jgi:hypothetical protein
MKRDHGVLILLLVVVMVFGLALGMTQAYDGVGGEVQDANHTEWTDVRPNPMERPADISAPAMNPGSKLLLTVKPGSSVAFTDAGTQGSSMERPAPVMKPGSKLLPAMKPGSSVAFTDAGTQGTASTSAMKQGSKLLPAVQSGSSVGFTDTGVVQSPGQVQMPGKMR